MAVTLIGDLGGGGARATWYGIPAGTPPPTVGDVILMALPDGEAPPSGWTVLPGSSAPLPLWSEGPPGRVVWRRAYGTETGFPFPAMWIRPPTPGAPS